MPLGWPLFFIIAFTFLSFSMVKSQQTKRVATNNNGVFGGFFLSQNKRNAIFCGLIKDHHVNHLFELLSRSVNNGMFINELTSTFLNCVTLINLLGRDENHCNRIYDEQHVECDLNDLQRLGLTCTNINVECDNRMRLGKKICTDLIMPKIYCSSVRKVVKR